MQIAQHARVLGEIGGGEGLDLGPDLEGANAVGEIVFIDGACPGNDYLGVRATDQVSVSLLKKRLNELDTGIRIVLA